MSKKVALSKLLAFLEFSLLATHRLIVQDPLLSTVIETSEEHDLISIDLECTHVEAWYWHLDVKQLPIVLALAKPLNFLRWHELISGCLIESTETVKGTSIIEEAQTY